MRRRRRKKMENVELNLAAMLDMAFQLLAFFVLTFKPVPVEGHLQMHLPPPVALTKVDPNQSQDDGSGSGDNTHLETLKVFVSSDAAGDVSLIKVGMKPIVQGRLNRRLLQRLNDHLKSIFDIQMIPFDRIQIVADPRLRYEELMKIVDVCTRQVLPNGEPMRRISFIETPGAASAP